MWQLHVHNCVKNKTLLLVRVSHLKPLIIKGGHMFASVLALMVVITVSLFFLDLTVLI